MAKWRFNDAQKRFPEVIDKALNEGPQTIAVARGQSVTISSNSRRKPKRTPAHRPTLAEVIKAAPKVPEFRTLDRKEYPTPPVFE